MFAFITTRPRHLVPFLNRTLRHFHLVSIYDKYPPHNKWRNPGASFDRSAVENHAGDEMTSASMMHKISLKFF